MGESFRKKVADSERLIIFALRSSSSIYNMSCDYQSARPRCETRAVLVYGRFGRFRAISDTFTVRQYHLSFRGEKRLKSKILEK